MPENALYNIMIWAGCAAGLAVYAANMIRAYRKQKNADGKTAGFGAGAAKTTLIFAVSVILAALAGAYLRFLLSTALAGRSFFTVMPYISFNYCYVLLFFSLFAAAGCFILSVPVKALDLAAPSLIAFSAVARIGCLIEGCCGGTAFLGFEAFPVAETELAFAVAAFIVFQFVFKKARFRNYLISYAAFRFALDFLRAQTEEVRVAGLTCAQILCVAAAAAIICVSLAAALIGRRKSLCGVRT